MTNILINTHSNLNVTAEDTIMISNYMNMLMEAGKHITLLTEFDCGITFKRNLEFNNYTIINEIANQLVSYIDKNHSMFDVIFIRNHNIIGDMIGKMYLHKTIFYGLDIHLNDICKMNNTFSCVITQSEKLKQKYIDRGIG